MFWVNFLHIYQPSNQSKEILEKVVNECYRPLFKGFLKIPNMKLNLNINAGLTELLYKNGYKDVIGYISQLAKTGRCEFTQTAKYHPLLPFLSKSEIKRQIEINHRTNQKYFGKVYRPQCFFPPEMGYSQKVGEVVSCLKYPLILLDEIAYQGGKSESPRDKLFYLSHTKTVIVFRERRVSNCIMSGLVRTKKEFQEILGNDLKKNVYLCTAMDGETFGHHRPGLEKSLFKILSLKQPRQIFFSEILNYFTPQEEISPIACTWASSQDDIEKGIQFYSWRNPRNKVQQIQWKFIHYLLHLAREKKLPEKTREMIDKALASDQFFWASGEPWWSIEMIEKGAYLTLRALKSLPNVSLGQIKKGEEYYKNILSTAFFWQRSGKIGEKAKKYKQMTKIPFKQRTLEKGKPEVYYAFIDMMKKKMTEAAKKREFERAILWRDAIYKIETKNDIYDAVHAVDILREQVCDKTLTKLMDKYKEKYKKIKAGQPEIRRII